jgi:uncharacterized lipoprotein YmbA
MRRGGVLVLLALSLLAAACGLGPRPDRSRFYTLSMLGADEVAVAPVGGSSLTLGLGPIVLPGYLDRTSIVRRSQTDEITISAWDRWAEPLRDAIPRTLQQDLVTLLGTSRVVLYPWQLSTHPDLAVDVGVLRFEVAASGDADVAAEWRVRRVADGAVLADRTSKIQERAGGADTNAAVAALSRALGGLSREIAAAVRELPAARRGRSLGRSPVR